MSTYEAKDIPLQTPAKSKAKSFLREAVETLLLTAIIFVAVNSVTGRFKIYGASMDTTFESGEYIIVNRLAYQFGAPQRGDVIVFVPPGHPPGSIVERLTGIAGETDFIKRIIGLPGELITIDANGTLRVNHRVLDEPYIREPMNGSRTGTWQLGRDEYFVLGDNRNYSRDSRDPSVGPIPVERIVGKVLAVYWPMGDWKIVEHYRYPYRYP